MIRCEHPCKYQKEGYCELDRAVSVTSAAFPVSDCIYYTPARHKSSGGAAFSPENQNDMQG